MGGEAMHLTRYRANPAAFARRAEPYLLAREAEHCLQLGLCSSLVHTPAEYPDPYLALVAEGEHVLAVALRTPPFNLTLSHISDTARLPEIVAAIATDTHALYGEMLPGVTGPVEVCRAFVAEWRRLTGCGSRIILRERIYQLDTVIPPEDVPGSMRRGGEADRALLEAWLDAFMAEALPDSVREDNGAAWVARLFASPRRAAYLWEDPSGRPVALAAYGSPTPSGIRIGPVYTPPEYRKRGYASALVAALSQSLLDSGRRFCFLFTNLANPTSNAIYQAIGYRPVSDVEVYAFIQVETEK
jgi:predicted GNAT family acetyltransferase